MIEVIYDSDMRKDDDEECLALKVDYFAIPRNGKTTIWMTREEAENLMYQLEDAIDEYDGDNYFNMTDAERKRNEDALHGDDVLKEWEEEGRDI